MRTMVKLAADAPGAKWWRETEIHDENDMVWNVRRLKEVPIGGPRAVMVETWFVDYARHEKAIWIKGMWDGYTILIDDEVSAAVYLTAIKSNVQARIKELLG